jgi:sensor histidine kinase YesM
MEQYPFIFSNQLKYRIARHAAFWGFWVLSQGLLYAVLPSPLGATYGKRLPYSMMVSVVYMIDHIFLAYSLMYFVIPVYVLKDRYVATGMWVLVLFLATGVLSALTERYLVNPLVYLVKNGGSLASLKGFTWQTFCMGVLAGLRGGITIGGLAAAIKLMKHWYVKQQRNLELKKENVESQLQLLKAQVHPHFLFNTLNNIYSYTQSTSPVASHLVMGLSEMLRYMLYEGSQPWVPLAKEIKMIEEYISLEQVRYGNRLELDIDLPEDARGLLIAPLMLLPFAENCFKHGTSNVLEHPWLSLQIGIQGNAMTMKLVNGKPVSPGNGRPGIGITNVRKRLELIYPGKHELVITNDPDVFIVNLRMELTTGELSEAKTSRNTYSLSHV